MITVADNSVLKVHRLRSEGSEVKVKSNDWENMQNTVKLYCQFLEAKCIYMNDSEKRGVIDTWDDDNANNCVNDMKEEHLRGNVSLNPDISTLRWQMTCS